MDVPRLEFRLPDHVLLLDEAIFDSLGAFFEDVAGLVNLLTSLLYRAMALQV